MFRASLYHDSPIEICRKVTEKLLFSDVVVVVHGSYNYSNYIPLLIGRRTLMTYVNKSALNAPPAARMSHRSDRETETNKFIDRCSRFSGFYQFNQYIQKQGHYYTWTPGIKSFWLIDLLIDIFNSNKRLVNKKTGTFNYLLKWIFIL